MRRYSDIEMKRVPYQTSSQVQQTWQTLSSHERKIIRLYGGGLLDPRLLVRCEIVLALVWRRSLTDLDRSGMAASSLVYEVMHRFITQSLLGLSGLCFCCRRTGQTVCPVADYLTAQLPV